MTHDFILAAPEVILALGSLLLLVWGAYASKTGAVFNLAAVVVLAAAAFAAATGEGGRAFNGALTNTDGTTFRQPGIWGISFGNKFVNQPLNTLFFAAGPTPTSGVYGRIDVTQ